MTSPPTSSLADQPPDQPSDQSLDHPPGQSPDQPSAQLPDREGVFVWFAARLGYAAVLAVCTAMIITAYRLTPVPAGMGTHEQLGLPACGFLGTVGVPCATCGMTTAFSLAVHGRILSAFVTQPAGAMSALLVGAVGMMSLYSLLTGARLWQLFRPLWCQKSVVWVGAWVIASWIYKIIQVSWIGR